MSFDLIAVYAIGAVFLVALYATFRLPRPFPAGWLLGLQSVSAAVIALCFVLLPRPDLGERPKTVLLLAPCAFGTLNLILMAAMLFGNHPKWLRAMSVALGAVSLFVLAFWAFVAYTFVTGMSAG